MPPENRPTKRRKLLQIAALSAGAALATGADGCASQITVGPDVPDAEPSDTFVGARPGDVLLGISSDVGPIGTDVGPIGTDTGPGDATDDEFVVGVPVIDAGITVEDAGGDS